MKGVAVSLYNKFDELGVLVDIIRETWDNEYHITVACNHPDGEQHIQSEGIDIDAYAQAGRVDYQPDMGERKFLNLHTRIFDSVMLACETAISEGVESVMHLHADAWPFSEQRYLDILRHLDETGRSAAVRGHGLEWRTENCPLGQAMDQFFIIDGDFARERALFDTNPLAFLPNFSIHNMFMLFFAGRVGLENIWWYSRMQEDKQWDGKPVDLPFTGVRPGIYNPEWEFVHIASDEFPDGLGKSVQAHYLDEADLDTPRINSFIEDHQESNLFEQLAEREERLNSEMRKYGFVPERWGREFVKMQDALNSAKENPAMSGLRNWGGRIVKGPLFSLLEKLPFKRFNRLDQPRYWRFHHDASYPKPAVVESYDTIQMSEYPDDMDPWFEDFYPDPSSK